MQMEGRIAGGVHALQLVAEKRRRQGLGTPEWDDRPRPRPEEQWIWEGFLRLSQRRTVGMGLSPIAYAQMESFLELFGVTGEFDRELFLECIEALDNLWMELQHGKNEGSNPHA